MVVQVGFASRMGSISPVGDARVYIDSSSAVIFSLVADREHLSSEVVGHFATKGWRRRGTQYLNPEEDGCQSRCACVFQTDAESNVIQREPFYEWQGEWENERGDIVTYRLAGEGRQLRGYGTFVPNAVQPEVVSRNTILGWLGK